MSVCFLDCADRGRQRIAVVAVVERVEETPVFGNQRGLRRRRARVDAEMGPSVVAGQILPGHLVPALPCKEGVIVLPRREKRIHPVDLELHADAVLQTVRQILQRYQLFARHKGAFRDLRL